MMEQEERVCALCGYTSFHPETALFPFDYVNLQNYSSTY